jgi:hypothetical protein
VHGVAGNVGVLYRYLLEAIYGTIPMGYSLSSPEMNGGFPEHSVEN